MKQLSRMLTAESNPLMGAVVSIENDFASLVDPVPSPTLSKEDAPKWDTEKGDQYRGTAVRMVVEAHAVDTQWRQLVAQQRSRINFFLRRLESQYRNLIPKVMDWITSIGHLEVRIR